MQEHALPQDVVGYRFHIIGNMTLKQFAEVAVGVVIAFIAYQIGIPVYIKVPVMIISAGTGALAAFVPLEEQPLDHWMVALFRALYRPTQFYWKRTSKIPDAFLFEPINKNQSTIQEVDLSPARRQRVTEYLRSIDRPSLEDKFDELNRQKLNDVMTAFAPSNSFAQSQQYITADFTTAATAQYVQETPVAEEAQPVATQTIANALPSAEVVVSLPDQPLPALPAFGQAVVSVSVPNVENISLPQTAREETPELLQVTPDATATFAYTTPVTQSRVAENVAIHNANLPFPQKPTVPNKIVGMVIDQNNSAVQNAIIEILTADGLSARAVKTDIFGQFSITTPLNRGTYTILTDKEGLTFPALSLTLTDQIVDPIEIRSL